MYSRCSQCPFSHVVIAIFIHFTVPGKVLWTTSQLRLWSMKWKSMARWGSATRVGFRKQLLNLCKSKCLSLSACQLVNLSWLAFVQIPRNQMGKNKYQKATAPQRNAPLAWFSDPFLICVSFQIQGLHGGVQIQGSRRPLWRGNFAVEKNCQNSVEILRFQRRSTSKRSSTRTTTSSGNGTGQRTEKKCICMYLLCVLHSILHVEILCVETASLLSLPCLKKAVYLRQIWQVHGFVPDQKLHSRTALGTSLMFYSLEVPTPTLHFSKRYLARLARTTSYSFELQPKASPCISQRIRFRWQVLSQSETRMKLSD